MIEILFSLLFKFDSYIKISLRFINNFIIISNKHSSIHLFCNSIDNICIYDNFNNDFLINSCNNNNFENGYNPDHFFKSNNIISNAGIIDIIIIIIII